MLQGGDYDYCRTDSAFRHRVAKFGGRLSTLIDNLIAKCESGAAAASGGDDQDDDDRMDAIVETGDALLERVVRVSPALLSR